MNRSCLFMALLLVLLAAVGVRAANTSLLDADIMKVALRAGTPDEKKFIDDVVLLVDNGVLPVAIVESTFLWAKKKSRYRVQYFKRGLQVQAEAMGITF
jgi:hypothetical protein